MWPQQTISSSLKDMLRSLHKREQRLIIRDWSSVTVWRSLMKQKFRSKGCQLSLKLRDPKYQSSKRFAKTSWSISLKRGKMLMSNKWILKLRQLRLEKRRKRRCYCNKMPKQSSRKLSQHLYQLNKLLKCLIRNILLKSNLSHLHHQMLQRSWTLSWLCFRRSQIGKQSRKSLLTPTLWRK